MSSNSIFNVADNSGAKTFRVFKKGNNIKYGSILTGSIASLSTSSSSVIKGRKSSSSSQILKKGDVYFAVPIRIRAPFVRKDGSIVSFHDNAVVLVDKQYKIIGSRVFGQAAREVKASFSKITALVSEVL